METAHPEKRARQVATRPEPTIIGNCDGWNPIVGKKTVCQRPGERIQGELPGGNKDFIHNLFTDYASTALDNLCMAREHSLSRRRRHPICRSALNDGLHSIESG